MRGLHLTADLQRCASTTTVLTDPAALRSACLEAVAAAGLTTVAELFHRYLPAPGSAGGEPVGITGVVLLAESHLAVHTWPELGAVTLDVYVCNFGHDNSARAHGLLERLVAMFEPAQVERRTLERGHVRAPAAIARWRADKPSNDPRPRTTSVMVTRR